MQNILYQQIPAMNHTHLRCCVRDRFKNSCVAQRCADMEQLGFANTDIRYPDLSANFMAAENPNIVK